MDTNIDNFYAQKMCIKNLPYSISINSIIYNIFILKSWNVENLYN
jgi:hypothetical protein